MQSLTWQDSLRQLLRENVRQYTMIAALLLIGLGFAVLTDGVFISTRNLSNLLVQTASTSILAMGMVLIIVTGNIDLSVGSTMGFCGALAAMSLIRAEWSVFPVVLATLAAGMLIGAWHGYWVAFRRVPAFIVTLASMLAFRGAIIGITDGQTLGLEMAPDIAAAEQFKELGQGYLPSFQSGIGEGQLHDSTLLFGGTCIAIVLYLEWSKYRNRKRKGFAVLAWPLQFFRVLFYVAGLAGFFGILSIYLGIPYSIILVLGLACLLSFIADHTVFGRHLYAIGGNVEAARFSGINVRLRTLGAFILMGLLVALAGIISTARLNAATTSAGQNAELDAIASAVIGGTSLMGGEGTIKGAIVGALVMSSLDNGMSLMNMDITYQYIIKGGILMLAVWADMASRD